MLSRDTIIIIAIFSALGAFILVLILVRVLNHLTSTSAPLPPIQPLAHHREHHIAKLEAAIPNEQSWYPKSTSLAAHHPFGTPSPRGSSTSLLPKHPPPSPDTTTLTDLSSSSAFSPASSHALALPSPSFNPARPGSSSSLTSTSEPGHANSPSSASSSYISSPSITPREHPSLTNLRGSHNPGPSRRQRPMSITSSHSTIHSKASRNTLRGLPHSRHSQIQIVLPAPLATGTDRHAPDPSRRKTMSSYDVPDAFDRRSLVDRWVSASESSPEIPNIITTAGPLARHSRVMSQPESSTFMTSPSAPPVPRVPSMYIDLSGEQQLNNKLQKAE
ncbi:hypothetical protein CVT24_003551 [Panaeolus cyanescens]|uniref:Uncharacterized protein n=1 Tax=Panaeolus cyanescens TaxID=181874 RepID=A0A409Y7E4_9AGAR|nr:hypothetical protein CVT24_003551 [Panaeolus cyanescens]